jgi:hypothetical protein
MNSRRINGMAGVVLLMHIATRLNDSADEVAGDEKRQVRGHRFSGGIDLIPAANRAWVSGSTGRCLTLVLAGSFPRQLPSFQFLDGLTGRGTKPPPQFGQTLSRMWSTHEAQNVHS